MNIKSKDYVEEGNMTRLEWAWDTIDNWTDYEWNDVHGWVKEDYMRVFGVSIDDASILDLVVSSRLDVRRNVMMKRPSRVGHLINEALHQGLDGWTIEQGLVIQAFLSDVAWSVSQIEEDERLAKYRSDPNFDDKHKQGDYVDC